jgi:hypothetical protein
MTNGVTDSLISSCSIIIESQVLPSQGRLHRSASIGHLKKLFERKSRHLSTSLLTP